MKIITLSLLLMMSVQPLLASDSVSLNSALNNTYSFYNKESSIESAQHFFDSELALDGNWTLTDKTRIQFKPRFRWDNQDRVNGKAQWREDGSARPAATFEELTLNHYGEKFEIGLGKQLMSWGRADLFNPTDDINPVDSLDVLNSSKLGQTVLSATVLGDKSSLQGVVLFQPTASRLPTSNNRWFRSTQTLQEAAALSLGFTPTVSVGDQIDNDDLRYGLRLTSSEWLTGWDLEFSYFHGADPVGVYLPELIGTRLNLIRVFPEFDEYGAGFSTTMGENEFHGVLSYHNSRDNEKDDDYSTAVIGGRRTFYDTPFAERVEEITVGAEYVKEKVNHQRSATSPYVDSGFGRSLTNSILAKVDVKFSADTQLQLSHVHNLDDNDAYFAIESTHKMNDDFEVGVRLDLLKGPTNAFFGGWSDNDRLLMQSTYRF